MLRQLLLFAGLAVLIVFVGPEVMGQPGPGGGPPPPPPAPAQVPIDGGLALLALAGGAYAVKKLRRADG